MTTTTTYSNTFGGLYNQNSPESNWRKVKEGVKSSRDARNVPYPYRLLFKTMRFQTVYGWPDTGSRGYIDAHGQSWRETYAWQTDVTNPLSSMSLKARNTYNIAYSRLQETLRGDSADLLALVMEHASARKMIHSRLLQMATFVDHTVDLTQVVNKIHGKHGDWRKSELRKLTKKRYIITDKIASLLATTPSGVSKSVNALRRRQGLLITPAELILELQWGWKPIIADVYASLAFFDKPGKVPVKGSAWHRVEHGVTSSSGTERMTQLVSGKFRVRLGGTVTVENAAIGELERLGISNPGQAIYEVMPFSWLLDWVSSTGDMISALDDTLICKLQDVYVTRLVKAVESGTYHNGAYARGRKYERESVVMQRVIPTTLPTPYFTLFPPDMTPARIAIVASLLILKLKKVKLLSLPLST